MTIQQLKRQDQLLTLLSEGVALSESEQRKLDWLSRLDRKEHDKGGYLFSPERWNIETKVETDLVSGRPLALANEQ